MSSEFVLSPPRKRPMELLRLVGWAVALAFLVWSWRGAEMRPMTLITESGNILTLIKDFFPPDFTDWRLYATEMVVTLQVAIWGTLLAVVCAVPLGILSSDNIVPWWVYHPVRRLMDAARAINEMVFAMLFVVAVGLGPFAGVLALWVHTTGVLAKLFSEAVEAIEPSPVEGVRSTGASFLEEVVYGVIPQVFPLWISYSLYRFESNVRSATVVGMVGAGGIGMVLWELVPQLRFRADLRRHGPHRAGRGGLRHALAAAAEEGALMPARYAVYYAPSAGDALHQAVTPLLGRDALGGLNVPQATPPGVDPVFWKAITRVPAHYGLHATLKAPFELRHSGMDSQLLRSTGEVASRFLPFEIPSLSLAYLGKEEKGFYALVPSTKCSLLSFLERACVMDLDAFRAPLKTEDVARRGHLSLEERSNLYMWGYHRVLDSFQFHITLTDGIADAGIACACGRGPAQGAGRRAGRSASY